jgi:hypothetical protein
LELFSEINEANTSGSEVAAPQSSSENNTEDKECNASDSATDDSTSKINDP